MDRRFTLNLTALALVCALLLGGCANTEIIESPKTAFVPETAEAKNPAVIWTSRALTRHFDYLGQLKVRSWTYEGALERLVDGGRQLHADAIIDVHYEQIGFLTAM